MLKLILLLIYLILIISVIFIERKNPSEALFWILVMICFPFGGAILYMIFGSTLNIKLISRARGQAENDKAKSFIYDNLEKQKEQLNMSDLELSDIDNAVISFNEVYNESPLTVCDKTELFTNGREHYERLFSDIKNAKDSIYVNFYTIHNDRAGNAFLKLLCKKASEGVRVWLMCDFVTSFVGPSKLFKKLKQCGGSVRTMKPYLTHYRDHRKIVIVDEKIGYIGGMNIGEQYAGLHKVKTPWRDTQLRFTGQGVFMLIYYFMTDWAFASTRNEIEAQKEEIFSSIKNKSVVEGNIPCQFVAGGSYDDKSSIKMCYLSLIRCAKKRLRFQSPYFIPDESILDAIKTAIASGVEVEVMVPNVKASFFLEPTTNYFLGEILKYGATVYKYDGYVHAKTIVVDDEICTIGSVNLDIRSLKLNDEICGIFYENKFVKSYNEIFDKDIKSCRQYTYEEFQNRSLKTRIMEKIFILFAPLM